MEEESGKCCTPPALQKCYKAVAETKRDLSVHGWEDSLQWLDSKFCFRCSPVKVFLPFGENSYHLGGSHNPGIVFIAEIKWYQSGSESCPVVSEPRREADRVPCHQMVYFGILDFFCWRSAGNFICREAQNPFNTANTLLEPAHNQCESSGLVHQFELQPKCPALFAGEKEQDSISHQSKIWVEGRKMVRWFSFQFISLTQLLPSFDICAWTEEDVVSTSCCCGQGCVAGTLKNYSGHGGREGWIRTSR